MGCQFFRAQVTKKLPKIRAQTLPICAVTSLWRTHARHLMPAVAEWYTDSVLYTFKYRTGFFMTEEEGNTFVDRDSDRQVLNARESADFLRISHRSLMRLMRTGLVPRPARVGRRLVWARSDLLAFVLQGGSTAFKKKRAGGRPRLPIDGP